jgi:hypothetical protein
MVSFNATKEESKIIAQIVDRAKKELEISDPLTLSMDIMACHANGTPLDLRGFLEASGADFGHDIHGIQAYIDRRTGRLTRIFQPRFAKEQE